MKALLLYPEFPDTFWSFKHALKFVDRRASLPPLGLVTIASMLPKSWSLKLVDVNVQPLSQADLDACDLVLISAMTVQRASAYELIERCKAAGKRIVAGGPLFTVEHDRFPAVDHFVLNEAEITLPPFLDDLEKGTPKRIYASNEHADVTTTPTPMWHLVDMNKYASMAVQYSRGCPFDCDFCNVTALFGHRPRVKSAQQILAELDRLDALGWNGPVFFVDDNLIGNKRHLKTELLPALIDWRARHRNVSFNTEASINLADDSSLMDMMVRAGFNAVFVGIETPETESLKECSKLQNLKRDLVQDVHRIHNAGMQVQGGFIVGFDADTLDVFQRQIDYIQEAGVVTAMVGMLQALPGTKLARKMEKAGRLIDNGSGDNADGETNMIPVMGIEPLRQGYRTIMRTIYSPGPYYARVKNFLREYHPPRGKGLGRLRPGHIRAFGRTILYLGILGKERRQYWDLVFWAFRHKRDQFSLAITLAVYGYHFRKTAELHVI